MSALIYATHVGTRKDIVVGFCDGAHLCLHMGGPTHKEKPLTRSLMVIGIRIILSFIQLSILIISPFKFKLREFYPTLYHKDVVWFSTNPQLHCETCRLPAAPAVVRYTQRP